MTTKTCRWEIFNLSNIFLCPDLIRNRHLSVFIGVCHSLSQSLLVHQWSQISVYRWPNSPSDVCGMVGEDSPGARSTRQKTFSWDDLKAWIWKVIHHISFINPLWNKLLSQLFYLYFSVPQWFLAHLSNCYFVCPYLLKSTFYSVHKYTKFIPRIIANPWCFLVLRATRVTYLHSSLQTRILSLNLFETSVFLRCMRQLVRYTDSFQFPFRVRSRFRI